MVDLKTLSVCRYVTPQLFETLPAQARRMGFMHAVRGPLVRSSHRVDQQADAAGVQRQRTIINN